MLLLSFSLSSCEKVKPYAAKLQKALKRDSEPKQVVGLPAEEMMTEVPPPPEPVKMEPVINKKARVAILGYHDFTESRRPTQMIIHIDDFRAQMQAIKDAELSVISMQQFLDWKRGKQDIPEESVMITIDDGWKDTHTLAMPVLREFGYPFTAFLYKNYISVGGRSMTLSQIQELVEAGGTICSHSVSHRNMAKPKGNTEEEKLAWLKSELEESHYFLEQNFPQGVLKTFAYPYGIFNDQVVELAGEFGYQAAFTVSPGKASWEGDIMRVNRYIIHGNASSTFDAALNFGSGGSSATGRQLMTEQRDSETGDVKKPLVQVYPPSGSVVKNRLPRIEVDLSGLKGVQSDSVAMRISGYGKVRHHFDKEQKLISYQVPQRLRNDLCSVQVSFRHSGNRGQEVIGWKFTIDKKAEYLDPKATFIRPADEPVDPATDLVLPDQEKTIENESQTAPKPNEISIDPTADPAVSSVEVSALP